MAAADTGPVGSPGLYGQISNTATVTNWVEWFSCLGECPE